MKTRNKKKKGILNLILRKIIWFILFIIVVYNLIYFVSSIFKINLTLFGISFFVVNSNSMRPELKQKDLIIVKNVKDNELDQEDIIVYVKNEDYRITRIKNIREKREMKSYAVKGDDNYYIEEIIYESIQGKMINKIIKGGIVINILRSKILTMLIIIYLILKYNYKRNIYLKKTKRKELRNKMSSKVVDLTR